MATACGIASADVEHNELREQMESSPFAFEFFQMVRLLEKLGAERAPVGHMVPPDREVVRFSAPPTFSFPASELGAYSPATEEPASLEVNFLGLNTINGPMPRVHTEVLLSRARDKDEATADFLDLFNHRFVSLFYRAWARYRLEIAYEKERGREEDVLGRLYALIGLGTKGLRQRMAIPDESALFFSGLLAPQIRSADGLRQILESYFEVPVEVRQFTGSWVPLPVEQQTVLEEGESPAECLGLGTVVGDGVWEQEGALTVRLGPMPLARYREFLPGSRGQAELRSWLLLYGRRAFRFVVQLVLKRAEVPPTAMRGVVGEGSRLGYESWLKVKPMQRDPDETTYVVDEEAAQ
jgi:type VI secretion system protein ImpH